MDYTEETAEVVRDVASFLLEPSDCSYGTVPELMSDVTVLNAKDFLKMAESENGTSVFKFLRVRGNEVKVTEGVLEAAAGNI